MWAYAASLVFSVSAMLASPSDDTPLRKNAEKGDPSAEWALGLAYQRGDGVPKDPVEGAKWRRRAAEHGLAIAQVSLGYAYQNGDGVPQDTVTGVMWIREAAEQSNEWAEYLLRRSGTRLPVIPLLRVAGKPHNANYISQQHHRAPSPVRT